jgi:hypothetical protein
MSCLVHRFRFLIIATAICAASLPERSEAGKREKPNMRAMVAALKGKAQHKLRAWRPSTSARVLTHVSSSALTAIVVDAVARAFGFDLPAPLLGLSGHLTGRVIERVMCSPEAGSSLLDTPRSLQRVASGLKDKIVASADYQYALRSWPSQRRKERLIKHLATVEKCEQKLGAMAGKSTKRGIFARLKAKLASSDPGYRVLALMTSMLVSGWAGLSNPAMSGVTGWASGKGSEVGARALIDGSPLREISQQLNEIDGDVVRLKDAGERERKAQ